MSATTTRDARLPFTTIEEGFLAPRDPILGYVKIGGKDPKVRYGKSTGKPWVAPTRYVNPPRFEVTTRAKVVKEVDGQGKAQGQKFTVDFGYVRDEAFHKKVGPSPTSLRVRLLYPTWKQNVISFLGAHSGMKWVCRGNGVEAIDLKRGACVCPCPRLKQFEGQYSGTAPNDGLRDNALYPCKPHGQLDVLLEDAEVFGGFWAFKTTSYESISNIIKSLRIFEEMFGRVDGLPLELRVMDATKSFGEGNTTQPIVTLVLPASMSTARQVAADAAAESRKFLPAGRVLDYETYREAVITEMEAEAESYAGEFAPETKDPDSPIAGQPVVTAATTDADGGPDFEVVEDAEEEGDAPAEPPVQTSAMAEPPPLPAPSAAPEPPQDSPLAAAEKTCRAILVAAKWQEKPIQDRLEHHRKQGLEGMTRLLDGLKKHMPTEYAQVCQGGLFDAPPKDGLPL